MISKYIYAFSNFETRIDIGALSSQLQVGRFEKLSYKPTPFTLHSHQTKYNSVTVFFNILDFTSLSKCLMHFSYCIIPPSSISKFFHMSTIKTSAGNDNHFSWVSSPLKKIINVPHYLGAWLYDTLELLINIVTTLLEGLKHKKRRQTHNQ